MTRIAVRVRALAFATVTLFAFRPNLSVAALCDGISPVSHVPLTTVLFASSLVRPTFVTAPPADLLRVFIVEQDGRIRIVKNGVLLATPFLDINVLTRSELDLGGGQEEGLLGLAFAPDYEQTGRFFVYHTDSTGANNLVVRYAASASDPDLANPASRQVVLTIPHPGVINHNGGMIAFGPDDGYLYIGTGDGGDGCDPTGNAQNLSSLLGKLHRIDVSGATYSIPANNPFVGVAGARGEIWSYGLRNPWRWSFDRQTSDLYIGDVGQEQFEEINSAPATSPGGENYGWDRYEGTLCPNPSCGSQGSCSLTSYSPPVLNYDHSGECSVTGGYVYRGCRMPGLSGTYFYSDYCAGWIHSFQLAGGLVSGELDRTLELAPGGGRSISFVSSFGEDARGEILIVDRSGGEVFKIVPVISSLEVGGSLATRLNLTSGSWTWEDLGLTSSHPIVSYQVYRQTNGSGSFVCIHQGSGATWSGDPQVPAQGSRYSYVVTARNSAGMQTSPGTGSAGAARVLSAAACPP